MSQQAALQEMIELVYETAEYPILWSHFLQDIYQMLQQFHANTNSVARIASVNDSPHLDDSASPLSVIGSLLPHLRRAIHLADKISALKDQRDSALGIIEKMPVGALMVSAGGRVLSFNQHAASLLQPLQNGLAEGDKLRFSQPALNLKVHNLIREVSQLAPQQYFNRDYDEFAVTSERSSGESSLSLLILPSRRECAADCVGILVTSANNHCQISEPLLRTVFGLTVAEARLARALVTGMSVRQVASMLNISVNTARCQLKSIFSKTGAQRQSELVYKILMSTPVAANKPVDAAASTSDQVNKKTLAIFNEGSLLLPDNRRLGYAESGDPNGIPVFYFHSIFSSRHQQPYQPGLLARLGIRWITPERPGYGLSDPKGVSRLLDWPNDVALLADYLGIDRFHVLGYSMGGAYAQACCVALPERVIRCGLISSMGPFSGAGCLRSMDLSSRFLLLMGRHMPGSVKLFMQGIGNIVWRDPLSVVDKMVANISVYDKTVITNPAIRAAAQIEAAACFNHGTAGLSLDITSVCQPWGFAPTMIRQPVQLWHGTDDKMVPHTLQDALSNLPHCRATYYPGEGHFLLFNHWHEILEKFIVGE